MSIGGFTFLAHTAPAQAEQVSPSSSSSPTTMPENREEILKRLERVEKELEQTKIERDKVRRERAKRLAEEKQTCRHLSWL
jgi:uncharacterized membrane protein